MAKYGAHLVAFWDGETIRNENLLTFENPKELRRSRAATLHNLFNLCSLVLDGGGSENRQLNPTIATSPLHI